MFKPPVNWGNSTQRARRSICKQRGTTMIEVMVAALVLSAGLLGLAAMQTQALKTASGLATQQVMVQALGAYSEARLTAPGATGHYLHTFQYTFESCAGLWLAQTPFIYSATTNQTILDMDYFATFVQTYTPCGSAAVTEFVEYENFFGQYNSGAAIVGSEGMECDYVSPVSRRAQCTLPSGEVIALWNMALVR